MLGDYVLSLDTTSGKVERREVVGLVRAKRTDLVTVQLPKEVLVCSRNHRFLADSGQWIHAENIKPQSRIVCIESVSSPEIGSATCIVKECVRESPVTVYNIEVERNRKYFVGRSLVLIHNMKIAPGIEPLP